MLTKKHEFDGFVIDKINSYIYFHDLSLPKIANEAGLSYQNLYQLLHKNQTIKLREYVALCTAFEEPLDYFLPKKGEIK